MFEDDEVSTFCLLYADPDIKCVMERAPAFMEGAFIHTEVHEFSKSKYAKYKYLWPQIVNYLEEQGIKNIYALPTDDKAEKWETHFGFVDTGVTFEGQKIMKYRG